MSRTRLAAMVGLLGFLVRVLHLAFGPVDYETIPIRVDQYAHIAQHLIAGEGYAISSHEDIADETPSEPRLYPTAKRTPAYPLFLAALYAIGFEDSAILWLQCVFEGLTCAMIVLVATAAGIPSIPSVLAGCAFALYVPELRMVERLTTEPLFTCLLQLSLLFAIAKPPGAPSWRRAIALGAVTAIAGLCRPTWLPYAIVQLGLLWPGRKERVPRLAAFTAIFLILITPWFLRNRSALDTLAVSTLSGFTLYVGNHPGTDGMYRDYDQLEPELLVRLAGRDEVEKNRILQRAALEQMRENGWATQAELLAVKAARFWVNVPAGTRRPTLKSLINLPILLGFLLGTWFALTRTTDAVSRSALAWLALPVLYLWGVHALYLSTTRMAFPVLPHAFILAASAAAVLWSRFRGRPTS
ncbi:MAG: hypothetical protein RL885_25905 [Planctomycetota bacterium]